MELSEVKHLIPGDRVTLEPGISCWRCTQCKESGYNFCPDMKIFATPLSTATCQPVHPADLCFKLPDNIGPETNVLVMGAGPIGLVTMFAARAFGAPRIAIVDVDDSWLSVAKELGANEIIKVSTNIQDVEDEVGLIQKAMRGEVDVSFDFAGFNKTMTTALTATRADGKVCLVGMAHNEMTVPLTPAAAREVDVVGIFRYKNTWPLCLEFLKSGKIDVKPLTTHRFGLTERGLRSHSTHSFRGGNAIKVMFNM